MTRMLASSTLFFSRFSAGFRPIAVAAAVASAMLAAGADAAEPPLSSVIRGAHIYDNWAKEIGARAPETTHPLYPADRTYAESPDVNWRCKECHGWDYKGKDGAYSQGKHATGIKGVTGKAGASLDEIIAILTDPAHGYDGLLDDEDLHDVAAFVSRGQIDMDQYIDRSTKLARGSTEADAAAATASRKAFFNSVCATCHGKDGLKVKTMPPLGRVANDDPWKALHHILNSHPGVKMPALRALEVQVAVDILAYVQTLPTGVVLSSISRGGHLYDNWYKEVGVRPPERAHPAYPKDKAFAKNARVTWRCRECHGWDYKGRDGAYSEGRHHTGIKGILGMAGAEADRIIAVLKDDTHQYGDLLNEEDLRDLANFISEGLVDMDKYIDRASRQAKGYGNRRKVYYETICANCHGKDGLQAGRHLAPLGKTTNQNPWKALHTILNGHPGEQMPALRALDIDVVVDLLAYVQSLPSGVVLSSVNRGGHLYDNWYKELGVKPPQETHPAYPKTARYAQSPRLNWRCKECHGWDYKGKDGVFGKGNRHYTGIKGIHGMAGAPQEAILAVLKDDTHAYFGLLSEQDFIDLANFISEGQIDMDRHIDPATGVVKGDPERRRNHYNAMCATCHGEDGAMRSNLLLLGKVANENPWKALHAIINGHPGEVMPALRALDRQTSVDILAYIQTLPTEELLASISRGGRLYDNWYTETERREPTVSHPAYPRTAKYAREPRTNWRCKECHGWDYKGKDGAYGEGNRHYTGIKGITGMAGEDPDRVIAVLKDETHGYEDLMDEPDFQDLANFITQGQVDMDALIAEARQQAESDLGKYAVFYTTLCADCHGEDGAGNLTMPPLGRVARASPAAALHRILNGLPDEDKPPLRVINQDVLLGIFAYTQSLPADIVLRGR